MKLERKKKPYFGEHKYSAKQVIRELSEHPRILEAAEKYPAEKSWRGERRNPVNEYLKEIVATPNRRVVDGLRRSLRMLWYRIFNGLEIQGLTNLKEQIDGKQVVYLPCHRSHLDYLLLSYVLHERNMAIPHIIAGSNLNMPGVGKILKSGGAVFMRRTLKDNPLYATAFVTYLHYLLDHNIPIEIFIEGGRSRTGKNLQPRTGLLSILIEYLQQRPEKDIMLVPVSFTYERIPEENSYINELNGKPKQEENLFELLNALKVLKRNYGKVYVSFAPAMSARECMEKHISDNSMSSAPEPDTPDFKEMAYCLGMEVMDQINIYTRTSALPVVATVLLSERHRGFHKYDLLNKSQFLVDVYQAVHPRAQDTLVESEGGLEGVVDFLIQGGTVRRIDDPDEDIFYFNTKNKVRLNLYKNIFVHHYVIPSIIALSLRHGMKKREELLENILFFDNLLRHEFMFPRSFDFTEAVNTMLNFSLAHSLVSEQNGDLLPNPAKMKELNILANIVLPFLESFHVAIDSLTSKKVVYPIDSKKLVTIFRENHQKLLLLGRINSMEGNLTVSYQNIIRFFTEEKVLEQQNTVERKSIIRTGKAFETIHELDQKLFPKEQLISN